MHWIIEKGQPVKESTPTIIKFHDVFSRDKGTPTSSSVSIYESSSSVAPVHRTSNVNVLVRLEADLSHIPRSEMKKTIQRYPDGKKYYKLSGAIEATFYSASTKYVLLYDGKRYDTVTAEYA